MSIAIAFTREEWALILKALAFYRDQMEGIEEDGIIMKVATVIKIIREELNAHP